MFIVSGVWVGNVGEWELDFKCRPQSQSDICTIFNFHAYALLFSSRNLSRGRDIEFDTSTTTTMAVNGPHENGAASISAGDVDRFQQLIKNHSSGKCFHGFTVFGTITCSLSILLSKHWFNCPDRERGTFFTIVLIFVQLGEENDLSFLGSFRKEVRLTFNWLF